MTDIVVLNPDLEQILILDTYYSLLWVERFDEAGEFELVLPLAFSSAPELSVDNLIAIPRSEYLMIIEDINPTVDADSGDRLIIKGTSSEIMLDWRVIEDVLYLNGPLQDELLALVTDNFVTPTNALRTIDTVETEVNADIPGATTIQTVYPDGQIYTIIREVCIEAGLGFKFRLSETRKLVFSLITGTDRSHEQLVNPRIVFSAEYDNVISSSYYLASSGRKNVVLMVTEDSDPSLQRVIVYGSTEPSGISRRETYREITSPRDVTGGPTLTIPEALTVIEQKGSEELQILKPKGVYDGEMDVERIFKYGQDFYLGDYVQCVIEGENVKSRIIERALTIDEDGGSTDYVSFDFESN